MRDYLKLSDNEEFMGFLYLGVPGSQVAEVNREPIGNRVKWMNE
jgi:hypothetical protein